jgi:transcriptional regulator with XRE-family HTH domain
VAQRRGRASKLADHSPAETLGQRVARLQRERGLTQVELAERVGGAQPVVSNYERDELRLHGQLIVRLTKILGVTADELLGLTPAPATRPVAQRRLCAGCRPSTACPAATSKPSTGPSTRSSEAPPAAKRSTTAAKCSAPRRWLPPRWRRAQAVTFRSDGSRGRGSRACRFV